MGLMLQVTFFVLKFSWACAVFLVLKGSADDADLISPRSSFDPSVVSPPLSSPPLLGTTKDLAPFLSPSTPTLLPPNNLSAPPTTSHAIVPSMPPSASQGQPPPVEDPILVPRAPAPAGSSSVKSPETSPSIHPIIPGSAPPQVPHSAPLPPVQSGPPPTDVLRAPPTRQPTVPEVPENKAPLSAPIAPVQNTPPPPRDMLKTPPTRPPIVPEVPDNKAPLSTPIAPVQSAPPPRDTLQTPPTRKPTVPEVPENKAPLSAPIAPVQNTPPPPRDMLKTPPTRPPIVPEVPDNKAPLSTPIAPVQSAPPPRVTLQTPPTRQPIVPEVPDTKAPISAPIAPVQSAPPPREMLQTPPPVPEVPDNKAPLSPPAAPVQIAPPPRDMLQTPPPSHHNVPEVPPSNLPVPPASPPYNLPRYSPPPIHRAEPKVPPSGLPVPAASPPSNLPTYSPPFHPIMHGGPPSKLPEPDISPISTTPPSFNRKRHGVPVAAPSHVTPKQFPPPEHSPSAKSDISPISSTPPRIDRKRQGIPVASPSYVKPKQFSPPAHSPAATPKHKSARDVDDAPSPLVVIRSPPHVHSPTPLPATSTNRHDFAKKNITTLAPYSHLVPPASANTGGPLSPVSPAQASPSHRTGVPFLSPEISPSGSSPKLPKVPQPQPIRALPPPPPNTECAPVSCQEPLTNSLPGFPCTCILPMQVGLRLGVALYTFFPLVSEFATEAASGVYLKQSQVRIMGANADNEDPDKTVVLMDLVPFGDEFDNTTAFVIFQRFWHKQVPISTPYFGDYEVLYVRYTGLPDSPPSAPSSFNEPRDNKGRTVKPVGVDVRKGQHKKGLKGSIVAVIILSASVAVILLCAIAWILFFRHKDRDFQVHKNPPTKLPSFAKSSGIAASMTGSGPSSISPSYNSTIAPYTGTAKTFSLSDMERATDNFAVSRILGEGGFGLVYSGVLEDGTKVAVKVLKRDDQQGDREFLAEVEMLSRLHHRNLVKLIGICTEEHARCLIYELIPNGSVESHLHGVDKEDAPLDWSARLKIALGAARGLAYLHEDSSPRVIHRDFKSSNILLEHDFTPKVSDFGLARSALDEDRHISTRVMGTFGYVAPEYAMTGHLLVKSDVYSYGVVLLELLTGRKPVDMSQPPGQENLVTWSRPLLTNEQGLELIVDKSLGPNLPFDSISKVAAIASMCVQPEVSHRPFMGEVVQALKLVSNECNATKDLGSRSCSQEDLSVDFDARSSTHSGHLLDPMRMQSPLSDYESGITDERGLPLSEIFSAPSRIAKTDSESFRRHSSSGPLRSESVLPLWQRMRRLSGGSVSEHGAMFKLWHGHH